MFFVITLQIDFSKLVTWDSLLKIIDSVLFQWSHFSFECIAHRLNLWLPPMLFRPIVISSRVRHRTEWHFRTCSITRTDIKNKHELFIINIVVIIVVVYYDNDDDDEFATAICWRVKKLRENISQVIDFSCPTKGYGVNNVLEARLRLGI